VAPIILRQVLPKTLFFNSRFESGNLREVEKVSDAEYNLYLNFDHNTLNYTQWYYFSVRNIAADVTVKFNIMNLQKDDSTYSIGNKPFIFSQRQNQTNNTNEWARGGFDIEYRRNKLSTKDRESAVSPNECAFNPIFRLARLPLGRTDDPVVRI
jgi:cytosolic carboxypeptidase protein 2/3